MVTMRAFVSFDYDNNEKSGQLFVGQGRSSSPTPFAVGDWSSKDVLPQRTWEETIAIKIARCNVLIVLAGLKTADAAGVVREIAMANVKNVPVFGVYVDGADTTTSLPAGLARNRTIPWKWDLLVRALEQTNGEGKNA